MDEQKAQLITESRPVVVTMPAEIDHGNAGHIGQRLSGALGSGTAVVIADRTATTFCSTAGIQALARACRRASADGIDLRVVVSPSGHVQRVLAIYGLDRLLRCYPSLAAARDAGPATGLPVPLTSLLISAIPGPGAGGAASSGVSGAACGPRMSALRSSKVPSTCCSGRR